MKIFTAVMSHETNVFSPIPTGLDSFRELALYLPGVSSEDDRLKAVKRVEASAGAGDFLRLARERGHEAVLGPVASALPAGAVVRRDYETIRDAIVASLTAAMPVDAVLLFLHGAQVADGYDDCEGDLIARLREIVGPDVPIGALLDLHGSLTTQMMTSATALIFCKEYPHTDYSERAVELFDIIEGAARGDLKPVMTRMTVPCLGGLHTRSSPGKDLIDHAKSLEGHDGVLSTSVVHGFSLGDVEDSTGNVLVVTDNAPARGEAVARDLAGRFWAIKGSVQSGELPIPDVVEAALAEPRGPVIIAEPGDNPGGGWPADNVDILRALLARDADAAVALVYDPVAVQICSDAGAGAKLSLRIGGKIGAISGPPLDVEAEVTAVNPDARQRTIFGSEPALFGPAVAIRCGRVDVVLCSVRTQPFSPDVFTELGIDPTQKHIIQLKSSQHFYEFFEPMAAKVLYCNGVGGSVSRVRARGYLKLKRPVWPLDELTFDATTAPVEQAA